MSKQPNTVSVTAAHFFMPVTSAEKSVRKTIRRKGQVRPFALQSDFAEKYGALPFFYCIIIG